jgi:hypothetical protein
MKITLSAKTNRYGAKPTLRANAQSMRNACRARELNFFSLQKQSAPAKNARALFKNQN